MRLALSGIILATTFMAPALAGDFTAASRIDAVTVFLQGADVTRVAEVTLPAGEHRILLADLPASIDPRSIRVEGEGNSVLDIASVDTKSVYVTSAERDAKRKSIEQEISSLATERGNLDQAIDDSSHQRAFLLSLADKQLTPQSSTETLKGIDVTQLTGLLDLVGQRLAGHAKSTQDAQARQKQIDEQVGELSQQLAALAPGDTYRTEATIHVAAKTPMTGNIRIRYRLNEAGWMPYYDARLTTPAKGGPAKLDIIRRAEVLQSTSENWENVALTLSTTRPAGATSAPNLPEEELFAMRERKDDVLKKQGFDAPMESDAGLADLKSKMAEGMVAGASQDLPATAPMKAEQRQAVLELAGFQANYVISGRVTVDNSGTAKKVRIASATQGAKLEAIAVPRLDATAYLTASFKVAGDGPLLPGLVNLYRDGVYVGQGSVPLLNANEETKLGFGADDMIKVTRAEVKKSSGEEGILTSSNVEERAWDITVRNLHDSAIAVTVFDRMPFSALTDVEIGELAGMTKPTTRDYEKRRGVLAWSFDLEPAAESLVKTGYRVSWPENMKIGMAE